MSDRTVDEIVAALLAAKVDFIIVGGVAAVLHGAAITTADLDIVHDRSPDNIARLLTVLRSLQAIKRGDPRRLHPDETWLAGRGPILLDTAAGPLDVLCELNEGQDYAWLLDHSEPVSTGDAVVRIVDLPTLIELKTRTGRPKDRLTLPILVAVLEERMRGKG